MSYKIVKNADGLVIGYGPNTDQYQPSIPVGATLTVEASIPPKPLAEVKATKLAQLEQARDAAERANVTVGGKVYSGSEAFQAKVSRTMNQAGRGKPIAGAADAWRTADAQTVVMTAVLLGQIEDAITAQGAAVWSRFWLRFDSVQAATTNAAVEAIIW